jgi:hypothetical protein
MVCAGRAIVSPAMTELIGIVAVAVVAWFAAGTIWNIRKGRELMRWMQDGLPLLGTRSTVRWLGSSVVEMAIRDGRAPFASATVVIFLEPRDMPWIWPFARIRGRRDMLIIRGVLREPPVTEFEALDPASWSGHEVRRRIPPDWPVAQAGRGLVVHHATDAALARASAFLKQAQDAGLVVARLSVRRPEPNIQVHVAIPDRKRQRAHGFFETVRSLAERALS